MAATFGPLNATTDIHSLQQQAAGFFARDAYAQRSSHLKNDLFRDTTIHHPQGVPSEPSLRIRPVDLAFVQNGLDHFRAVSDDYLHSPLPETFNWDAVAGRLGSEWEGDWYIVVFRSVRKATADAKMLYEADAMAHSEAITSGGLLKYWYAALNQQRECLAMCIWASRDFARLATKKPYHRVAASLAAEMYETYDLERWELSKVKGEERFRFKRL